jgi:hypothetical protein
MRPQVLDRVQIGLTLVFLDDDQFLDASTLRHQFRRILFKLATDADVLPPSLFIAGLHVPRIDRAVCLGGFADIYLGSYRGEAVAVKRLRINDEHLSTNKVRGSFSPISVSVLNGRYRRSGKKL